jgi:hypothetical protein
LTVFRPATALLLLAFVIVNAGSDLLVMAGRAMFGLGQGALVTLLFNVPVTDSPKELAGEVGSLCGTIDSVSASFLRAISLGGISSFAVGQIRHRFENDGSRSSARCGGETARENGVEAILSGEASGLN